MCVFGSPRTVGFTPIGCFLPFCILLYVSVICKGFYKNHLRFFSVHRTSDPCIREDRGTSARSRKTDARTDLRCEECSRVTAECAAEMRRRSGRNFVKKARRGLISRGVTDTPKTFLIGRVLRMRRMLPCDRRMCRRMHRRSDRNIVKKARRGSIFRGVQDRPESFSAGTFPQGSQGFLFFLNISKAMTDAAEAAERACGNSLP